MSTWQISWETAACSRQPSKRMAPRVSCELDPLWFTVQSIGHCIICFLSKWRSDLHTIVLFQIFLSSQNPWSSYKATRNRFWVCCKALPFTDLSVSHSAHISTPWVLMKHRHAGKLLQMAGTLKSTILTLTAQQPCWQQWQEKQWSSLCCKSQIEQKREATVESNSCTARSSGTRGWLMSLSTLATPHGCYPFPAHT